MSHINYKRGETRTFIVRNENEHWRRHRGRKGLIRDYHHLFPGAIGIRNWCPCCTPLEWNRTNGKGYGTLVVHKALRNDSKKVIRHAVAEMSADD